MIIHLIKYQIKEGQIFCSQINHCLQDKLIEIPQSSASTSHNLRVGLAHPPKGTKVSKLGTLSKLYQQRGYFSKPVQLGPNQSSHSYWFMNIPGLTPYLLNQASIRASLLQFFYFYFMGQHYWQKYWYGRIYNSSYSDFGTFFISSCTRLSTLLDPHPKNTKVRFLKQALVLTMAVTLPSSIPSEDEIIIGDAYEYFFYFAMQSRALRKSGSVPASIGKDIPAREVTVVDRASKRNMDRRYFMVESILLIYRSIIYFHSITIEFELCNTIINILSQYFATQQKIKFNQTSMTNLSEPKNDEKRQGIQIPQKSIIIMKIQLPIPQIAEVASKEYYNNVQVTQTTIQQHLQQNHMQKLKVPLPLIPLFLLITALLPTPTSSTNGVLFLAEDKTISLALQCISQVGFEEASPILLSSATRVEIDGLATLYKARSYFKNVSLVYLACFGRDAEGQVAELMASVPGELYDRLYVFPYNYEYPQCEPQPSSFQQNCRRLRSLVEAFSKYKMQVGIVSQYTEWMKIYGQQCSQYGNHPLYWIPYDWVGSFDNFVPFGGWTKPDVKAFYSQKTVCGVEVDLLYRK